VLWDRTALARRRVRRAVLRRRRILAALLTGVAVLAGMRSVAAPPEPTVDVLVATHDLAAGTTVSADDLAIVAFRPGSEPDGLVDDPVGELVASAVRRGEPLTDARLLGTSLTDGHPGIVAAPVRLPDAAVVGLLRSGDLVDVLAADPQGGPTEVVASDALVLVVPAVAEDSVADALPGRLVILGLDATDVTAVSGASVTHFLTVAYAD
jgi:Flp pilus assembly protein CpaB